MFPFDLKRALAGEAVVTRDGREVTQLVLFDTEELSCLYGVIERCVFSFFICGENCGFRGGKYDLFMKYENSGELL